MTKPLIVQRWGKTEYEDAHRRQLGLLEDRIASKIGDVLVLTEHEPVVTVGRGVATEGLGGLDLPIVEVERGGEATYHGPGQLVAYPIIELPEGQRDLHSLLRMLEEVLIGVVAEFGLRGVRRQGLTGVWLNGLKVASIGIAVRRWVTYHGVALNLHTDLQVFRRFQPCGLAGEVMTRLADHTELPPGNVLAEVLFVKHFCRVFGFEPVAEERSQLP